MSKLDAKYNASIVINLLYLECHKNLISRLTLIMSLRKDAKYNASIVINYMHTHLYPAVNTNFMLL